MPASRRTSAQKARAAALAKRYLGTRRKALAAENALFADGAQAYAQAAGKLLRRTGLRKAHKLIQEARAEWHAAKLTGEADTQRWRQREIEARLQLRRRFLRALPNFRQWENLRRAHLKAYGRIVQRHAAQQAVLQAPLAWTQGEVPAAVQQLRRFGPPFREAEINGTGDSGFLEKDESSVQQNGILVNDVVMDHDEDTAIILGLYGLPGRASYASWAACGLSYTMPLAGRLYLAPELANLYNHVTLALTDRFGLSDGKLHVTLSLDLIVAPYQRALIHLPKTLFTTTLLSEGDPAFDVMPDVEPLYAWERTTAERFAEGEVVDILVAAEVKVQSELDDMRSHVEAVLAWQLRRLGVGVVP